MNLLIKLDMQENAVSVRPLEEGFGENGKGFLYLKQGFSCEVVAEFEETVYDAEIIVIYEDLINELIRDALENLYNQGITQPTKIPWYTR